MWRKLSKRLFKDDGWHEVIWTTAIVTLFQFTIGFKSISDIETLIIDLVLDILQGLSIGLFLFLIVNVVEIRFENHSNKQQKYNLTINTDTELSNISNAKLIHDYFKEMIVNIIKNCHDVKDNKNLNVDPHVIYGHIIHSSMYFKQSIISVDLDLDAWYYACELNDFEFVSSFYKNKKKSEDKKQNLNKLRAKFSTEYQTRRRLDLTYQISENMQRRINDPAISIGKRGTVKRLIVLNKEVSQLTEKEFVIFALFMRISKTYSQKIWNKYLVRTDISEGSDERKILDYLQDIVIFDSEIAYKEYLSDKNTTGESTIITNNAEIKRYIKGFDDLFNQGNEVYEIFK